MDPSVLNLIQTLITEQKNNSTYKTAKSEKCIDEEEEKLDTSKDSKIGSPIPTTTASTSEKDLSGNVALPTSGSKTYNNAELHKLLKKFLEQDSSDNGLSVKENNKSDGFKAPLADLTSLPKLTDYSVSSKLPSLDDAAPLDFSDAMKLSSVDLDSLIAATASSETGSSSSVPRLSKKSTNNPNSMNSTTNKNNFIPFPLETIAPKITPIDTEYELKALQPAICKWENCSFSSKNMADLVTHVNNTHVFPNSNDGTNYECKWQNCPREGKTFNARYKMQIHMRIHTHEKPHPCPVCGKRFSRVENLKIHVRTHTGEKPFGCAFCEKRFNNSSDRFKHQRTHENERPYCCGVMNCTKRYTDPSSLRKHLKTTHDFIEPGKYRKFLDAKSCFQGLLDEREILKKFVSNPDDIPTGSVTGSTTNFSIPKLENVNPGPSTSKSSIKRPKLEPPKLISTPLQCKIPKMSSDQKSLFIPRAAKQVIFHSLT